MGLRITSLWHVVIYSLGVCALAVGGPILVLRHMLGWLPDQVLFGICLVISVCVLSIALPLSLVAINSMRVINGTVDSLNKLVKFDAMTGVMSRNHFLNFCEQKRSAGGFILLIDADHFKKINDTHGHEAGDFALKHIATALNEIFGAWGQIGRLGGEEFAVRLPGLSHAQAELLAATICTKLRNGGFEYENTTICPTVSIGLVPETSQGTLANLLRRADRCLYQAKAHGRDCYVSEDQLSDLMAQYA